MDFSQAGQTFSGDYANQLTNLQNQDAQNRAFINARQDRYLRSTQQAPSDTAQVAATGTPDGGQLPASPDIAAPANANSGAGPVTAPVSAPGVYGNPSETPDQTASESARLGRSGTVAPFLPNTGLLNRGVNALIDKAGMGQNSPDAQAGRTAALNKLNPPDAGVQNQVLVPGRDDAAIARLKAADASIRGGSALAAPADAATKYDPVIQSAAQSAGIDPTILKRLLGSESSFNPTAVSPRGAQYGYGIAQIAASHGLSKQQMEDPNIAIPFAAKLLKQYADQNGGDMNSALLAYKGASSPVGIASMQPVVAKILNGLAPGSNAQAATVPQQTAQAPAAPAAQQGPKFTAADGSAFTLPQQYNDGQIQQMQQQAVQVKNALQLAWLHYQNGTSPDNSQVMQLQQAGQQLNQHLYDADIYAKTQQAQAGNPQAFSALLNEYSNKVGQPIQVVPEGNGVYSLRAKGGQVIAHGDPASLAGTLGGVLNSGARAMAMELAKTKATSYATESGKAEANQPVEMAKLQTELAKQMGVNASDQMVAKIKTGELKATTNVNGQFLITDPNTRKSMVLDPNKPNQVGAPTEYHQSLP